MQLLDIVHAPKGSRMTLRTQSTDAVITYAVLLKRFTDSGGGTVMTWSRDEAERTLSADLDDAFGFHIIITATTQPNTTAKMRAELTIGDYSYNALFSVPPRDNIGWSVILPSKPADVPVSEPRMEPRVSGPGVFGGPGRWP